MVCSIDDIVSRRPGKHTRFPTIYLVLYLLYFFLTVLSLFLAFALCLYLSLCLFHSHTLSLSLSLLAANVKRKKLAVHVVRI